MPSQASTYVTSHSNYKKEINGKTYYIRRTIISFDDLVTDWTTVSSGSSAKTTSDTVYAAAVGLVGGSVGTAISFGGSLLDIFCDAIGCKKTEISGSTSSYNSVQARLYYSTRRNKIAVKSSGTYVYFLETQYCKVKKYSLLEKFLVNNKKGKTHTETKTVNSVYKTKHYKSGEDSYAVSLYNKGKEEIYTEKLGKIKLDLRNKSGKTKYTVKFSVFD